MPVKKSAKSPQPGTGLNVFPTLPAKKEVLSTHDIAQALGIKPKTAERKLRAGVFPGAYQDPRAWRLRKIDFTTYIISKSTRRPL